ncbi:MAG: pyridoxamine 5'-phosphate oxidase family protein, partial [Solirubrobacterales bacterium]
MASSAPSERARVRRVPARADYDRATIDAILDEALVAHLGFAVEGQPYVIPTLHARSGDEVYIHGSAASRMVTMLGAGIPACL